MLFPQVLHVSALAIKNRATYPSEMEMMPPTRPPPDDCEGAGAAAGADQGDGDGEAAAEAAAEDD